MRITATPASWISYAYDVLGNGVKLCTVNVGWLRDVGQFELEGVTHQIRREPMWGDWVLTARGREVARANKPSAMFRSFTLTTAGRSYTLSALSAFGRSFTLEEGDETVGHVSPAGWFTRKIKTHFPPDMPLAAKVFAIWLVVIMWKRGDESNNNV